MEGEDYGMKNKNKQKRFSDDQIRSLESMFDSQTKLEPRVKMEIARELGLQPRQVAIWFQNRRARWKSKQIEQDYKVLKANYDNLHSQFQALKMERQSLHIEMNCEDNGFHAALMNGQSNYVDECIMQFSEFEHDNSEAGASQPTTQSDPTTKRPKRSANFSNDEDVLLVSAWLNTSLDAIHSNEQKRQKYWQRVHTYFHKNKDFTSDRSSNSLMNRWSTIQQAVNKFCGCYAQIEARHQSGLTEQDKIIQAKVSYLALQKYPFSFEHCWTLLRFQPKWFQAGERKKIKKSSKATIEKSSTSTTINLDQDNTQGDSSMGMERPLAGGKKLEKEREKYKKNKEGIQSSMIMLMEDMREEKRKSRAEKTQLLEQLLAIEQKRDAIEQKKEEERIMLIDTTGMPELQAEYYRRRQREIMDKLG